MIKWYLVLYIIGGHGSMTTIPTPYGDKISCEHAANEWDDFYYGQKHTCVQSFINDDKGYVCQPNTTECQVVK